MTGVNVYAECVGYALQQCYDSNIAILRSTDDVTNEELLQELKLLVQAYKIALLLVDVPQPMQWEVPIEMLNAIEQANSLEEAYKH